MNRGGGTKEKRCVPHREPKQKKIVLEIGTCWDILENPIIWTSLLLWGKVCLMIAGISTKSGAPVSISTERDWFLIWRVDFPNCLNGRIGESPCSSSESHLCGLGGHWKY